MQADEPAAERLAQNLGDLGLADAGLAFEEQRPAHFQSEKQHGRERAVADIAPGGQQLLGGVDGGRQGADSLSYQYFSS